MSLTAFRYLRGFDEITGGIIRCDYLILYKKVSYLLGIHIPQGAKHFPMTNAYCRLTNGLKNHPEYKVDQWILMKSIKSSLT